LRYIYFFFGIGLISAIYTIETLKLPKIVLRIIVFVCVLACAAELSGHLELGVSMGISWTLFFIFLFIKRVNFAFLKKKITLFLLLLFIFIGWTMLENDYVQKEYLRYVRNSPYWKDATQAWLWISQHAQAKNIAYVGRPVPFPLYGKGFRNNVFYVSVNKVEPAKLHYYPDSYYCWGADFESLHKNLEEPFNYRGNADYHSWWQNLKSRNADYLFIYSLHQTKEIIFPIEDKWAREHANNFQLVFAKDSVRIYKIIKD